MDDEIPDRLVDPYFSDIINPDLDFDYSNEIVEIQKIKDKYPKGYVPKDRHERQMFRLLNIYHNISDEDHQRKFFIDFAMRNYLGEK